MRKTVKKTFTKESDMQKNKGSNDWRGEGGRSFPEKRALFNLETSDQKH